MAKQNNTNIIAVDGPAASGKGTLARRIARALGYAYLDTGMLYRATAWEVIKAGGDPSDPVQAIVAAQGLSNGFDPEVLENEELKTDETGQAASKVAAIPEVREALLELQREFAAEPGVIFQGALLDGRDIGTVICPDAPVKIYIQASLEVRAERRLKELQSYGIDATYEAVLGEMRERDERDASRSVAPMKPADDAFVIDTSTLGPEEVFAEAMAYVNSKLDT